MLQINVQHLQPLFRVSNILLFLYSNSCEAFPDLPLCYRCNSYNDLNWMRGYLEQKKSKRVRLSFSDDGSISLWKTWMGFLQNSIIHFSAIIQSLYSMNPAINSLAYSFDELFLPASNLYLKEELCLSSSMCSTNTPISYCDKVLHYQKSKLSTENNLLILESWSGRKSMKDQGYVCTILISM